VIDKNAIRNSSYINFLGIQSVEYNVFDNPLHVIFFLSFLITNSYLSHPPPTHGIVFSLQDNGVSHHFEVTCEYNSHFLHSLHKHTEMSWLSWLFVRNDMRLHCASFSRQVKELNFYNH
jgi:hypothetical protein